MHVTIDERELGSVDATAATVGEVVEAMRMHVEPGAILVEVELDGVVLSAGEEDRWARRAGAAVARLVLRTQTLAVFVATKRRDIAATLEEIAPRLVEAAGRFRAGDDRVANGLLAVLMEELRLALLLDEQLRVLEHAGPPEAGERLQPVVAALIGAQERKAWPEVGDLLDRDLQPVLAAWRDQTLAGEPARAVG